MISILCYTQSRFSLLYSIPPYIQTQHKVYSTYLLYHIAHQRSSSTHAPKFSCSQHAHYLTPKACARRLRRSLPQPRVYNQALVFCTQGNRTRQCLFIKLVRKHGGVWGTHASQTAGGFFVVVILHTRGGYRRHSVVEHWGHGTTHRTHVCFWER